MNGKCFEIGRIQAFLDGELTPDLSARFTNHVADCDACAALLARAEEEMSIVFPALDREFNTLVPTQRLWTRINDSIVEEKRSAPFWQRFRNAILAQIASPSLAAAAGVLIVFGIFAAVWSLRSGSAVDTAPLASNTPHVVPPAPVVNDPGQIASVINEPAETRNAPQRIERAGSTRENIKPVTAEYRPAAAPVNSSNGYIPGEESYVKTIENLSSTVENQKDTALRPSARVTYERDMAVVDDAIKRMKHEVRKNPKNESAKQVLYSSYQNKIDLLNSIAQKEELMSLK
jgi:hypothetical protein